MTDKIPSDVVKPSLEYLHQYKISSVEDRGEGWAITFENGAEVENLDPRIDKPEFAEGVALLTTMYDTAATTMVFGRIQMQRGVPQVQDETIVVLNPLEYKLTDPRFDASVYPQRGETPDPA